MSPGSKGTRRTRAKEKTPELRSRRRLQFDAAPLLGKTFFLHVQSASKARELEKKLKELGGVVEKFLSKELSCVVTDQPIASVCSKTQKKETTSLGLSGLRGQTRAQAILQKSVKQQKQAAKSTDVLTNAEKWGIQVKPVEQVLKWIDAQKKHQASAQPIGRVYNLRGSFLKVEDHSRQYRPLVKELNVWPRLNLDAPPGFSPFDEPISMRTRSRSSSKSPARGSSRGKAKQQQPSGSDADKKGYCELCDATYTGMKKHVASKEHKMVASRKGTYDELDRLISRGKTLKEFEDEARRRRASKPSKTTRVTRSRTRSRSPVAVKSSPKKSKKTPTPPRRNTPSRKSQSASPARRTPNSSRKASKKVTPIKLVRFQDRYSVAKSTSKKRRRNETDNISPSKSAKRKKTDRYTIVESTPMRIRLRRRRRKGSPTARSSMFFNPSARSP